MHGKVASRSNNILHKKILTKNVTRPLCRKSNLTSVTVRIETNWKIQSYLKEKKISFIKGWTKIDNLRLEKGSSFIRSNFYQALNFGKRFLRDQMKIKAPGKLAIFKIISQCLKISPKVSYHCRLISKSFMCRIVFDNL